MQQEERSSINVPLTDGLFVDICTESGANAFLQAGSESAEYLSQNIELMSKICAKRRLNAKDKSDLVAMNCFFGSIFQYGSRDVFGQHVQQSTIEAWLDHVVQQIKRFSTNRNWITTGKLQRHDSSLLESCVKLMFHAVPVALAFECEFFKVLADFVKARKGTGRALPSVNICDAITIIVSNSYHTSKLSFGNTWTNEKTLKKFEATGILEQFIRCATVPQPSDCHATGLFRMLDEFQECVPFVSKKVRPGQPFGDAVIAILEGRDGSRVKRPSVINKLLTMVRFASSVNPEHNCGDGNKLCEFKIAPVKDYIEGSRPAEPDWLGKKLDQESYEYNVKLYLSMIKEKYSKVRPNQVLCLIKYQEGFACCQAASADRFTSKEKFSQEAVLAFKAYMKDDDGGPLFSMLGPGCLFTLTTELHDHYGYEVPDLYSVGCRLMDDLCEDLLGDLEL